MKLKKLFLLVIIFIFIAAGSFITIIFSPAMFYTNKLEHKNFIIYHTSPLDKRLTDVSEESFQCLKNNELFHKDLKIEICLNEGFYPKLVKAVMGSDLIRSFSNKVVIHGTNCNNNSDCLTYEELDKEEFPFPQALSHSFVHCLQYERFGLLQSNPIAGHAEWKWEGFAEYATIGATIPLSKLISIYLASDKQKRIIELSDKSKTTVRHFKYLIMTKYCLDVKKLSFENILKDKTTEEEIYNQMISWFNSLN